MKIQTYAKTVVAVCSLLILSSPAVADDNDSSPGWWGGWGMHSMMGRGDRRGRGRDCMMGYGPNTLLDRVDGRLAFLKTELKITDTQSEVWSSLAQTIRINSETHNAMQRQMMEMHDGEFFKKPLPDRLIIRETHLETRLQQVKNVREEVEKLYAVLDDGQKKSADEIMLPMMGMGCGMGRGMMSN